MTGAVLERARLVLGQALEAQATRRPHARSRGRHRRRAPRIEAGEQRLRLQVVDQLVARGEARPPPACAVRQRIRARQPVVVDETRSPARSSTSGGRSRAVVARPGTPQSRRTSDRRRMVGRATSASITVRTSVAKPCQSKSRSRRRRRVTVSPQIDRDAAIARRQSLDERREHRSAESGRVGEEHRLTGPAEISRPRCRPRRVYAT